MDQIRPVLERILSVAADAAVLLVGDASKLKIEIVPQTGGEIIFKVAAKKADMGKLIGSQGRTARSLRVLLDAMSHPIGARIRLDITELPD